MGSVIKIALMLATALILANSDQGSQGEKFHVRYEGASTLSTKVEKGRVELESIEKFAFRSAVPRNGECWRAALENLKLSCSQLTEDVQVRLAISFTSCFSAMIGNPNYICAPDEPVKNCLKSMDDQGIGSFRQFFLHTSDMCHYIQSELWQMETERAVNNLQLATLEMGETVNEQRKTAESILTAQQKSQEVQEEMLKENYAMYDTVLRMRDVFSNFSQVAKNHQDMFMEIFNKLTRMQELVTWIQSEMSLVDFVLFYVVASLFSYFATTTDRTRQARVWIVLTLGCSVCAERMIFDWMSSTIRTFSPEEILSTIAIMRKVVAAIVLFILLAAAAMYRDYQVLNNNLLYNLRESMDHVLEFIQRQEEFNRDVKPIMLEAEPIEIEKTPAPIAIPNRIVTPLVRNPNIQDNNQTLEGTFEETFVTPELSIHVEAENSHNTPGFHGRVRKLVRDSWRGFTRWSASSSSFNKTLPSSTPKDDDDSDQSFNGDEPSTELCGSPEQEEPRRYNLRERKTVAPSRPLAETVYEFRRTMVAPPRRRGKSVAPGPSTWNYEGGYYSADEEDLNPN